MQGYNAQAVVNEQQIVLAAEITVDSPDFGHLEPMIERARASARAGGDHRAPGVVLADAGYWHQNRCRRSSAAGCRCWSRRTRATAKAPAPGGPAGCTRGCARCSPTNRATGSTEGVRDDRAGVRRCEVQPRDRPLPTTWPRRRVIGMAAGQRHSQPPETPPPPDITRHRVRSGVSRGSTPPPSRSKALRRNARTAAAELPDSHIRSGSLGVPSLRRWESFASL